MGRKNQKKPTDSELLEWIFSHMTSVPPAKDAALPLWGLQYSMHWLPGEGPRAAWEWAYRVHNYRPDKEIGDADHYSRQSLDHG